MRILFFVFFTACFTSSLHAGPRSFYPEYDDPELQQCLLELTDHLTENTSYTAEEVLRERSSSVFDARDRYEATRNTYKTSDRSYILLVEGMLLNQELNKIRSLREGFEFELWETMFQVVQICSFAILKGETWRQILVAHNR